MLKGGTAQNIQNIQNIITAAAKDKGFLCEQNTGYKRENGYRCYRADDDIHASYIMGICEPAQSLCNIHVAQQKRNSVFTVKPLNVDDWRGEIESELAGQGLEPVDYKAKFNGGIITNPILPKRSIIE